MMSRNHIQDSSTDSTAQSAIVFTRLFDSPLQVCPLFFFSVSAIHSSVFSRKQTATFTNNAEQHDIWWLDISVEDLRA